MITSMDTELHEMARTVDPAVLGSRVRDARLAKGLTQTAVAGAEMSTAYVSRIESGQRRPDPELIEVLAARLDLTVDELVMGTTRDKVAELQLVLDWAEMALKTGDAESAVVQVDAVLGELSGSAHIDLHRSALRTKAGALLSLGQTDDAIILLEDLTVDGPFDLTWIESMRVLSIGYRDCGEMTRAVEVGERALSEIRQRNLDGAGEAVAISMVVASAYAENGDVSRATRLVRRAIVEAEKLDSAEARAKAYWTASVLESRVGDARIALALARKALTILETSQDLMQVARLRSQLGILTLRMEDAEPEEALTHLRRAAIDLEFSDASAFDLAVNRLHQARAHFLLGDFERAGADATATRRDSHELSPLVSADAAVLLGQIAISQGDEAGAKEFYRDAVHSLSAAGADSSAAQLWFELGSLLEDVADTIGALDAYRRAGASSGLRSTMRKARTSDAGINESHNISVA